LKKRKRLLAANNFTSNQRLLSRSSQQILFLSITLNFFSGACFSWALIVKQWQQRSCEQ